MIYRALIMGWALILFHVLRGTAAAQGAASPVYDLRSAGPGGVSWVAAVQDQGALGDCWSFASTTAMDSNLIKSGVFSASSIAPPMQLSMWHLAATNGDPEWLTYHFAPGQGSDYQQPLTGNYSWGGWTWMAAGYATRGAGSWDTVGAIPANTTTHEGGGPVLIASNPLNAYPLATVNAHGNLTSSLPPVDQGLPFVARNIYYYDSQITTPSPAQQIARVKNALVDHGGLTTYMYASGGFIAGNATAYTSYFYNGTQALDHAVTIIGWDDNYQVAGAPNPGAWLIQNSWGLDWTENHTGVFYAAYDSKYVGKDGVTAFVLEPNTLYNPTVLQNQFGPVGPNGNSDYPTGLSTLDAAKTGGTNMAATLLGITGNTILGAIGLTSQLPDVAANISFYTGWGLSGPENHLLGYDKSVFFDESGYSLFDLNSPLLLPGGSELVVVVDFDDSLPVIGYDALETGNGTAGHGLSYYFTGTEWRDFAEIHENPGVFFTKGYTLVPEPGTYALVFAAGAGLLAIFRRRRRN